MIFCDFERQSQVPKYICKKPPADCRNAQSKMSAKLTRIPEIRRRLS